MFIHGILLTTLFIMVLKNAADDTRKLVRRTTTTVAPSKEDSKKIDSWMYYCEDKYVKCPKGTIHTVCMRNLKCEPLRNCTRTFLTSKIKALWLDVHNNIRNLVANGTVKEGSLGSFNGVQDMETVNWDNELEYVMSCYFNMCWYGPHDKCRNVKRFFVGQNVGLMGNEGHTLISPNKHFKSAFWDFMFWIEMTHVRDPNIYKKYVATPRGNDDKYGHYTQLVHAKSKLIGCSHHVSTRNISKKNSYHSFVGCNYGPGGNMIGVSIFVPGNSTHGPGSMCTERNQYYNALCGKSLPIPPRRSMNSAFSIKNTLLGHFIYYLVLSFMIFLLK